MKREERSERAVGWALVSGGLLTVVGCYITYAFITGSVHRSTLGRDSAGRVGSDPEMARLITFGVFVIFVGVALFAGGLFYGIWRDRHENVGPARTVADVFVVARYAVTKDGIYLTDPVDIENEDRPRFHVRLTLPNVGSAEFNTSEETFWWAGEGMRGTAELTGKWLARFTPDVGD